MKPSEALGLFLSYSFSSVSHCIAFQIEGLTGNFLLSGLRFGCCTVPHRSLFPRKDLIPQAFYTERRALLFPEELPKSESKSITLAGFRKFWLLKYCGFGEYN